MNTLAGIRMATRAMMGAIAATERPALGLVEGPRAVHFRGAVAVTVPTMDDPSSARPMAVESLPAAAAQAAAACDSAWSWFSNEAA